MHIYLLCEYTYNIQLPQYRLPTLLSKRPPWESFFITPNPLAVLKAARDWTLWGVGPRNFFGLDDILPPGERSRFVWRQWVVYCVTTEFDVFQCMETSFLVVPVLNFLSTFRLVYETRVVNILQRRNFAECWNWSLKKFSANQKQRKCVPVLPYLLLELLVPLFETNFHYLTMLLLLCFLLKLAMHLVLVLWN